MPDHDLQLVDQLSPQLLHWARRKTGDPHQAEDLVQEVWLQYFSASAREKRMNRTVAQPEHLLWKVARYVWLRTLRRQTHHRTEPLSDVQPDPSDFAADLAEKQEQQRMTAWLHQRIVNLNQLQRQAMILHYVEGLPQRKIAHRLGLSETTLRWHLFETRRKLREGASKMNETTDFVYTPRQLGMGINGQDTPHNATHQVRNSLLMQNICCACYHEGRTAQELAEMLGVARPYIEHDLRWLIEQEFLTESRGRYFTAFLIKTSQQEMALYRVFEAHKPTLCDAITQHLLAHEEAIRSIGFIGSDRPMNKLLWLLIYRFCCHLPLVVETPEPPIRPDGGKYWPLGFDRTDPLGSPLQDFDYNGSMYNAGFCWFGLHNFGMSEIEDMMDAWTPEYKALRTLLEKLIHAGFDPGCVTEQEQFTLAQLISKGFVTAEEGVLRPNFVIFTSEQYRRLHLEIFRPLADALQPEIRRLADDLHDLCLSLLPPHLEHLVPLAQSQAQHDVAFTSELMAFHDGTLYHPVSKRDGEFLTLAYIHRP